MASRQNAPTARLRPDSYPATRTVGQEDSYFGTRVADPFRWLENADDPEVLEWTSAQHDLAHAALSSLPTRKERSARLTEVWNFPRSGQPVRRGERLFVTRNNGLQAQAVLFVREEDGTERTLLDPNTLSEDGTVALMEWAPSHDGRLLAYALSESGEDWRTVRIRDVDTGRDLPDTLEHIKFSPIAWMPDGTGFFYSRFEADAADQGEANREQSHQLFFHRPGTGQPADVHVFAHPTLHGAILQPEVTDDGRFLVVTIAGDSFIYNRLWYARLAATSGSGASGFDPAGITAKPIVDQLDASYELVGTAGDRLIVKTTKDAPRGRIVSINPEQPDDLEEIIPQTTDVIAHAVIAGDRIVVTVTRDAHDLVLLFSQSGAPAGEVPLPGLGATTGAGAGALASHTSVYIPFSTFLEPMRILEYDLERGEVREFFSSSVPGFDPSAYKTRLVFATSRDGTRVPVFVTTRRDAPANEPCRTILYGYGGFDVSLKPAYPAWLPAWLESGGVYAVAVLRGGGEYGDEWHLAGMFERKQNVFDDFAAAAEHLIATGITTVSRLAIEGGSNGGLLVAATMLQRPELFGAVLCHVPVADMLRYQHFTAGRYWTSEYGDAELNESHFRALRAYSPVHNVRDGRRYPPILIMSADHDDRVVPMHSKKLAARLQQADPGENVVLLRIETKAGHGAGKPTSKQIDLRADVLAFLDEVLES